jgi:hypothetical protein
MPPEAEDLLADGVLESMRESKGQQHGCHADSSSHDRQPYDKPRKRPLPVKGNASGNKGSYIQTCVVLAGKLLFYANIAVSLGPYFVGNDLIIHFS